MAQLSPEFPGLGGHPSLSLRSAVDGAPVLCDEPGVLSKFGGAHDCRGPGAAPQPAGHGRPPVPELLPSLQARDFARGPPDSDLRGIAGSRLSLQGSARSPPLRPAGAPGPGGRHQPASLPRHVPGGRPLGHWGTARVAITGGSHGPTVVSTPGPLRPPRTTSRRRPSGSVPAPRPASCSDRPSWSTTPPHVTPRRPPAIVSSRRRNRTATWTMCEEDGADAGRNASRSS